MYDAFGILFLILTGSFLLFLPLAAGSLVVWLWEKVKLAIKAHHNLNSRKTLGQYSR